MRDDEATLAMVDRLAALMAAHGLAELHAAGLVLVAREGPSLPSAASPPVRATEGTRPPRPTQAEIEKAIDEDPDFVDFEVHGLIPGGGR